MNVNQLCQPTLSLSQLHNHRVYEAHDVEARREAEQPQRRERPERLHTQWLLAVSTSKYKLPPVITIYQSLSSFTSILGDV